MYLSKLSIQNFRSIKDVTIDFQKDLNVFVGKNNTGKSSIIDAIRLALGTSMNNPTPIWISEDDFYKDSNQQDREESFTIKMEFADLNEKQRVKFFEIVDFDLANINDSIAKLEYNASWPLKNGSRVSVKRTGGPEGPEKSEVPQKIMEQFSVIYLPALRDAETALTAGN
ncbi:MAG: AAA family ATPase, partial [Fibrobacter sp.]|nr:AAA family ATPase [Fibrobacter sp.]